jgi:hypothetical protein
MTVGADMLFLESSVPTTTSMCTVTSAVTLLVTYEALTSLTTILQSETHLTSGLIFLNFQSDLIEHVWNKFH